MSSDSSSKTSRVVNLDRALCDNLERIAKQDRRTLRNFIECQLRAYDPNDPNCQHHE